jgi:hypothetical protein
MVKNMIIEKEKEKNSGVEVLDTPQAADIQEITQKYMEIQKKIMEYTKKGDFQGIVSLLSENSRIIQEYTEIQKKKEEEKLKKIEEIDRKIQEKITEIQKLKQEIRDLNIEKRKIQGYEKTEKTENTRIINRENHEYIYEGIKFSKAIDVLYEVLYRNFVLDIDAWREFNKKHSISWNFFIQQVKAGKYPQKQNLLELINIEDLNQFYEEVRKIEIL